MAAPAARPVTGPVNAVPDADRTVEGRPVGRSIPGRGSPALASGRGTYVNDITLPGMAHMAVLRSPYPHALIRSIDASAARARTGVLLVLTGETVRERTRPIPMGADPTSMGARPFEWWAAAPEHVRYAGEAVAAIVAEDPWTANAALDDVFVDYEELPTVADPVAALAPESPLVEAAWGDNVMFRRSIRFGEPDGALASAPLSCRGMVRSSRITGVPIEPRGMLTSWDPYRRQLTTWDATQQPHVLRTFLAESLRLPETSVRVIQPAVGGAFGLKQPLYQEQVLCGWASIELGRPVKWIEQRAESFLVGGHARDTRFTYEVGFTPEGRVLGMRVEAITDVGAPAALLGWTMSFVSVYCVPGPYDVPNVQAAVTAVVTNKCPWSPYRGFGKDAAAFLMDRVMDRVARETGVPGPEVRRRNFIPPEAFPYDRASSAILDSGNYPGALDKLLAMTDYAGFPGRQARAQREGRRIGLGIGQELTPEGIAIPGSLMNQAYDGATVRIDPSGGVSVLVGVTNPGTGNDTALAQLCAEALGVPLSEVRVVQGDTDACPYGLGNYSSRSTMIGGGAVRAASLELRDKLLAVAASVLEAPADDLSIAEGRITVSGRSEDGNAGIDYRVAVNEIYRHTFGEHADRVEPGLEATRYFRMSNIYHQPEKDGRFSTYPTWPNGTSAAEVEVDEETGVVRILGYWLVEDAGRIVNPLLADANLHGGIAQGIGSAMYEALVYDESAQLQTATLMDYTIPTAVELPSFQIQHQETPSPFSPLGMKGVGESGMSSTLGALASAIENAFPELDLRLTDLPLTPQTIWRAIRDARESAAASTSGVVRS